jgi:nitroimidazol reductase NimA-like FMN-containing flavoprotein (pyridoxamine 5'-phosphate oxidase superfamily)
MTDYPVTERNRVKRAHERGKYDRQTVHGILDAGLICHLSYNIDGQPFIIPTSYWRDGETVYVHGSAASRTMRVMAGGIDACLAVTHLDGIVMARSGYHHSLNYRSVVMYGVATLVDDPDQKTVALKTFMDQLAPGRWDECRGINDQEFKATSVLAMQLEDVSAKVRNGPPIDDEEDYASSMWAGVVPIRTISDTPIDDPRLTSGAAAPDFAKDFRFTS